MPVPTSTGEHPTIDQVAETPRSTPGRPPRSRRPPGGWVALAVTLVLAVALGGGVAWRLTARNTPSPVTAADRSRHTPAATATGATAVSPASPALSSAAPATPAPATAAPATAAPTPSASGSVTVVIAAAAAQQANAPQVAAFLAGYFEAINDRDYQAYLAAFDDQARPDFTMQQFLANYGTTTDSDATLVDLSPASTDTGSTNTGSTNTASTGAWAATVTFVSHQSPALSTTNSSCTDWDLTLLLETSGNSYVIGRAPASYPQTSQAC
jgi:hypothetical protein